MWEETRGRPVVTAQNIELIFVDDDEEFRTVAVERFRKCGFRVSDAADGESALTQVQRRHFDVAVLDMRMPGMPGLEVLQKLKAADPECEVIILTGEGTIETAVKAMKLGAFDYLAKPFSLAELEDIVLQASQQCRLGHGGFYVGTPGAGIMKSGYQGRPVGISFQEFVEQLSATGLVSAAEVSTLCERLPDEQRPTDGDGLAALLIHEGKLTEYQATTIAQGRYRHLVFGDCVILDKLGAGGMGVVFKARHRRMDRLVAIKVLPPESLKSADAVERFYREVKATARLLNPNIVAAFDAGKHDGMHYLVMEYIDGRDLGQIVAAHGPLPVALAVECVLQAAKGLEYAHRMGIIHRDIKPSNLLISHDGQVKILDMGLARLGELVGPDVATAAQLTHSGQIMGTVDYMSPEQAQDAHRADERSDIYSLGCTLYQLLTGEPPYGGDTMMNRMMAHQQASIPSLCRRRADVPKALEAVFRRMVSKQPRNRQQSMGQVIVDLKASLAAGAALGNPAERSFDGDLAGFFCTHPARP
jgi:ActR/RegA family two-component response regulator/tRNA A-37 threonylcarbamoyl transferase component Bud32